MLDVAKNPSYGTGSNQTPATQIALDTGVVHTDPACIVASQRMLARRFRSMSFPRDRSGGHEIN